jgi:hypothetical protein
MEQDEIDAFAAEIWRREQMGLSPEDRAAIDHDMLLFGRAIVKDGKRIDPLDVFIEPPTDKAQRSDPPGPSPA